MAGITAIDAGTVGLLVSLYALAQATSRDFKLMNLSPRVEEVLELTNLRSVLEVCSVPEMLELLCEAISRSQAEAAADVETSEIALFALFYK